MRETVWFQSSVLKLAFHDADTDSPDTPTSLSPIRAIEVIPVAAERHADILATICFLSELRHKSQ